jgi:hypothetical protein
MHSEVILEIGIRAGGLLVVALRVFVVAAPPAELPSNFVGIEVLLLFRQTRGVMRPYQPSCQPVLVERQMGDSGIDMVPLEPAATPLPQRGLIGGIQLAEVMERRRRIDRIEQILGATAGVAEHRLGPLARTLPHGLDVAGVGVSGDPIPWR